MPTYDYKCENCNNTFEFFQSMKDDPMTLCPECGHSTLKKLISMPAGLIFKGTGFYQTDYVKKNSSPSNTINKEISDSSASTSSKDNNTKKEKPEKKENKAKTD